MPGHKSMTIKCSQCGAPIKPEGEKLACPYCGMVQILQPVALELSGDDLARQAIDLHLKDNYTLSIQTLEQAIKKGVSRRYKMLDLLTIMGNNYMELGEQEKALTWYSKAIDLDKRAYKAWVGMGISYRKQGKLQEAERCYQTALSIEPKYAELHASLGALYFIQGKAALAVETLEKAVRLDPSLAIAHANLALAYALAGRFEPADASLRQAVALGYKEYENIRQRIAALKALS